MKYSYEEVRPSICTHSTLLVQLQPSLPLSLTRLTSCPLPPKLHSGSSETGVYLSLLLAGNIFVKLLRSKFYVVETTRAKDIRSACATYTVVASLFGYLCIHRVNNTGL